MGWGDDKVYEAAKGLKITAIVADNELATLALEDGRVLRLHLEGDCCSSSYYTDTKQFNELIGTTIHGVEERDGESREGLHAEAIKDEPHPPGDGEVSWHFLVFTTDKGHVTIDWRNDSNGYYDGVVHAELA